MKHSLPVHVRLVGFLRPYLGRTGIAFLAIVGTSAFTLALPRLVAWAIDQGLRIQTTDGVPVALGSSRTLVIAGLAVLGAAVMRGLFAYLQTYTQEWLSQRVAYDLRNAIYNRLQGLSFAFHDRQQTGEIMSRATQDVEGVRMFIGMGLLRLAYVAVLVVIVLILMALENARLAIVAWSFLPLIAIVSGIVNLRLRPLWLKVQEEMAQMGAAIQENLSGIRVVKAFGREDYESRKFNAIAQQLYDDSYRTNRLQALNTPILNGLWMLSIAATLYVGGREVLAGRLSVGELTAFNLYLTLLQQPVRAMGWMVNLFARANSAGKRIFEILDTESVVKEKPDARPLPKISGHVRFENVAFSYDAISPVLRNVDIDARPGEIIALLGQSGSGKTTVVSLLPRFYDVTAGRILIDGRDIRDVTLDSLRANIGIVQQDVFLFHASIRENIAYGAVDASDEDIVRAAKAARLHDFISSLPDGYDTWVGERGATLSGGQKQRLAIARTILLDPRILILDDSTSSVDMETEFQIQQALQEVMKGRTTFVIAQRLRTVKQADQILVLQEGRIVERGRHDDLIRSGGFYQQIYDLELRDQVEALDQAPDSLLKKADEPAMRSQSFPAMPRLRS